MIPVCWKEDARNMFAVRRATQETSYEKSKNNIRGYH